MKLTYLSNSRLPTEKAHGLQVMKVCESFAQAGCEVELVVPRRRNELRQDAFDYYGLERSFKVMYLPCIDLMRDNSSFNRFAFWFELLTFMLSARKYLRRKDYGLLYTRELTAGLFFSGYSLELHAVAQNLRRLNGRLLRRAGKIITVTQGIKDELISAGIKKEKILVAPDGVDLKIFDLTISQAEARRDLSLPEDRKILGYTGKFTTMEQDKGIENIFQALKSAGRNDWLFAAAGGSEAEIGRYRRRAAELGISDQVVLLGECLQSRLAIFQKACDMLLMPFPNTRHYAHYMSPLKMFEYMASLRPIIATDLPSIREVLDESNAVLVKPDDPAALAAAIAGLLADPQAGSRFAEAAYQKVKDYTWENRAGIVLAFTK